MAADPKWYDALDVLLAAAPVLAGDAGTPSAAVTLRLYNDKALAGADTLPASELYAGARTTSTGQALAEGLPLVDRRMVEARITQGLGGKTVSAGQWTELGVGGALALPSLASGEGVELEFRLDAPADAQGANVWLSLSLAIETASAAGAGASRIAGDGVHLGIGDALATALVDGADVVENPAGADSQVRVGPVVWIAAGVPWSLLSGLVTVTASTAGSSRYVLLSLAADGTLTQTDGAETTDPLAPEDKPAVPVGEVAIAFVARDDTAAIQQADVEQVYQRGLYQVSAAALVATVGPGLALVDGSLTVNQTAQTASLTASSVNSLWLLRSGQLEVTTDGAAPAGTRALLLAELVTDGAGVTELRDRRRFLGHRLHRIAFDWLGTVAAGVFRYAINPSDRPAYVLPIRGLRASVAVGGTVSGSTRWKVEVDLAHDDTWTAITDTTTAPEIAFGATDLRSLVSILDSYQVPAGARIRASVDQVPGGADSADGRLELLVVEA